MPVGPNSCRSAGDNHQSSCPTVRRCQDAFPGGGEKLIHVRVGYRTSDGRDAGSFHADRDLEPVAREPFDDDLSRSCGPGPN